MHPTVAKAVSTCAPTHADARCSTVTERQPHRLSSGRRGEVYALRAGIDVHRGATDEAGEHQAGRPRDVDRQGRRGGHRPKALPPCKHGLLRGSKDARPLTWRM